jgi:ATP-dependent Clp protease ATP-binding subunit ClpB
MQEALQAAQDVASQLNQQEISTEHFLLALLDQSEGVTRPLLEKVGVSGAETLLEDVRPTHARARPARLDAERIE